MEWKWSDTIGLISVLMVLGLIAWGLVSCSQEMDRQNALKQLCYENGYGDYRFVNGEFYCVAIRDGQTVVINAERLK